METEKLSCSDILDKIKKGTMILPVIQRKFVWKEKQITSFLDSMAREYPIGTLLLQTQDRAVYGRVFPKDYSELQMKNFKNHSYGKRVEHFVIYDGQQRIQSLVLSLLGTYQNGKELYLYLGEGSQIKDKDNFNIKYYYKFLSKKPIIFEKFINVKILYKIIIDKKINIYDEDNNIELIINAIRKKYKNEYEKLLDLVDEENIELNLRGFTRLLKTKFDYFNLKRANCTQDELINIFIRVNNGGTALNFAQLIYSYLTSFWPEIQSKFDELIKTLKTDNRNKYIIDFSFIIKTCMALNYKSCEFDLTIIDDVFASFIRDNWDNIAKIIKKVFSFLQTIYIHNSTILKSNLSLIPIIYSYYYNYKFSNNDEFINIKRYLYISLLKNAFSSHPEHFVDTAIKEIKDSKEFNSRKILKKCLGSNKISKEDLESKKIESNKRLILNLIYFKHTQFLNQKLSNDLKLDIDHIYPKNECKKYFDNSTIYNNIANYCYLTSETNRSHKKEKPTYTFFNYPDKIVNSENDIKMLELNSSIHLLDDSKLLFHYNTRFDDTFKNNFEIFLKNRKKRILKKINEELL